jgi:hypothetical protein
MRCGARILADAAGGPPRWNIILQSVACVSRGVRDGGGVGGAIPRDREAITPHERERNRPVRLLTKLVNMCRMLTICICLAWRKMTRLGSGGAVYLCGRSAGFVLRSPAGLSGRKRSSVVRTADAKYPPPAASRGRSESSSAKSKSPVAGMYERSAATRPVDATANLFTCHMKWQGPIVGGTSYSLTELYLLPDKPAGGARKNMGRQVAFSLSIFSACRTNQH